MNTQELARAVLEVTRHVGRLAIFVLHRYWVTVIFAAVAVSLLLSSWSWLREQRVIGYTLLDGPAGGAGRSQAVRIADEISRNSSVVGFAYSTNTVHTNGFAENLQLISQDTTGRAFGFTQDGFGENDTVRALLPLETNYLHILCRRAFLKDAGLRPEADGTVTSASAVASRTTPITLEEVCFDGQQCRLKPGRVFLGPKGSGSQQAARLVMEFYGLQPDKYQCLGVSDWNDMRAALATGHIDLAFQIGPHASESILKIARDGDCVLLDLAQDADAIEQMRPHVTASTLKRNSYRHDNGFCNGDLRVLSVRRVLIASRSMSDGDAYFLAKAAESAIPPPVADSPERSLAGLGKMLRYLPHPGASLAWNQQRFSYLPQGLLYFFLTFAFCVVIEFIRFLSVRLQLLGTNVAENARPEAQDYVWLSNRFDDLQLEWETAAHPLAADERTASISRLKALREQVAVSHEAGRITDHQYETLMAAIRGLIRKLLNLTEGANGAPEVVLAPGAR